MTTTLDLPETLADATGEAADYATVRNTVGVYPVTAPLVRITGDDRLAFLDQFLSKGSDFVEPDTTRECLALTDDGAPFALLLHLELGEETWLLPRTPVEPGALRDYLDGLDASGDVTVEVGPAGWGAVAFEGPRAWAVAATFVDFDISGVTLHSITPVEVDGTDAHLARVGTTGEYGYLVLTQAVGAAQAAVLAAAAEQQGGPVGTGGLARVQAEAGLPYYHQGFGGLPVAEADLAWIVDWARAGEFRGSGALVKPTVRSARIVPVVAPAGTATGVGAPVLAGDVQVGTVVWRTPSANPDEELLLARVESPFWASGLELAGPHGETLRTVTLPRVLARSSHVRIA